jgi:uncharacterized protein YbjQ (UPF0145 family)
MRRFQADGVRTSLLDVPGAAGLASVGLEPVGEVMGCMVQQLGWSGFGGCGWTGYGPQPTTLTSGRRSRWAGYAPYVDALYRGYDTAQSRMLEEAVALGADGVVGVRVTAEHLGAGNREFVSLGTAVRARGPRRPASAPRRPFFTDRGGSDVAKLLQAGWVPVSIAFGISVGVRHDDYRTVQQSRAWAGNTEVTGYTELVQHVRADARAQFGARTARAGADGALVSSQHLQISEIEPSDGHADHVAEATVVGTTIARFARGRAAPPAALTIVPLRRL